MTIKDWVDIATIVGNFSIFGTLIAAIIAVFVAGFELGHLAKTRNADVIVRLWEIEHGLRRSEMVQILPYLMKREPIRPGTISEEEMSAIKVVGSFLELVACLVNSGGLDNKMLNAMWGRERMVAFFNMIEPLVTDARQKGFRSTLSELEKFVKDC